MGIGELQYSYLDAMNSAQEPTSCRIFFVTFFLAIAVHNIHGEVERLEKQSPHAVSCSHFCINLKLTMQIQPYIVRALRLGNNVSRNKMWVCGNINVLHFVFC